MSVVPDGAGSTVKIVTEYNVAGRVAQFGRGVMEDVSRRLVGEMAACIATNIEADELRAGTDTGGSGVAGAGEVKDSHDRYANLESGRAPAATVKPVNAIGLLVSVFWARVRRLFASGSRT
jgi:hypothetical protein